MAAILFRAAGCLVGERHDGSAGVGRGMLRVLSSKTAQVLAGGVNGAVDGAFIGVCTVLLILVEVIRDSRL